MHRPFTTAAAACALLAALAAAQQARIPVNDLIHPRVLDRDEDEVEIPLPGHQLSGIGPGRVLQGERTLFKGPKSTAWLDESGLARLVGTLAGLNAPDVRVHSELGQLVVPRAAEQRVTDVATWIRSRLPPIIQLDVVLDATKDGKTTVLARSREWVRGGRASVLADVARRTAAYTFNVEIAQAAATGDPLVAELATGTSVAVRARRIPGQDAAILECVARVAESEGGKAIALGAGFGDLDRVQRAVAEAGFACRVERGKTTSHVWTGQDGRRLRLRLTPTWEPTADTRQRNAEIVHSSLLSQPVLDFRSRRVDNPDDVEEPEARQTVRKILEHLIEEEGASPMISSGGLLALTGVEARPIVREFMDRVDAHVRAGELHVSAFDAAIGAELPADGSAPAGARLVAHAAGPILRGRSVCFSGRRELSYLRDWDTEVATASRIPAPRVALVEEGWAVTACVRTGAGGKAVELEIEGKFARLGEVVSRQLALNSGVPANASTKSTVQRRGQRSTVQTDSIVQAPQLPRDVVTIERPHWREVSVATRVPLGDAPIVLRRPAAELLGAGRELMLVVRAR